ncbi:metal ABC transporter solute-binding protein, Zn/Mn family [Lentibacillus sediminis]|uniref:metal ABC transporter solute-binding protein, Zn/Mn family n=1 Tax=Lentibacillus sediminis TaxID=1940529 RepID=UPI000C1BC1E1|nr:zinc ABC transporter substrate-binding protein [Lentibacillus sediminis]
MRNYKILISLLFLGLLAAGCSQTNQAASENQEGLTIYTTIYPIQYAVERIGGDTVTTETVYPPGVDAHSYEPASKDITKIAEGDAFIYLGAGMEGFAETAADALASQPVELVELGQHEELFTGGDHPTENEEDEHEEHNHDEDSHKDEASSDESHAHGHSHEEGAQSDDSSTNENHTHEGHSHGDHNPHIWLDPLRMLQMAELITDKLIELNPEEETLYTENFTALQEDLLALDGQYTGTLEDKTEKQILVSHAAYSYWEERYGIEQIAINGLSTSSEPSQKELTAIIDQAEKHQLDTIIFEQNTSDRVTKIIQEEIGADAATIHNLSVLTEKDISNGEDYLSIMKDNLEVLDQVTK